MPPRERLLRFTPAERFAHRSVASLGLILTLSGLILYLPGLSLLVARRPLVEGVHVVAGLLLPLPVFAALLSPAFRADLGALNRFMPSDWAWLRNHQRRSETLPVGKFNAGQKLAAAAFAAAGVVLFGTGIMLLVPTQLGLSDGLRQGATVVHDATTVALVALLLGHAALAYRHPEARRALRTGSMDREYAEQNHSDWARASQDEASA
ncbi:MAG: formate dehydrogenase subunit gamma [Actinomycetota bacterium]|jgi:formate dehydrogenase subunit gamma|nr:formate dehydrogenase subunit gamma [Actinomycetota bacterium]